MTSALFCFLREKLVLSQVKQWSCPIPEFIPLWPEKQIKGDSERGRGSFMIIYNIASLRLIWVS